MDRECYDPAMSIHSNERQIAALLRELMVQSGTAAPAIESRLGWEPGRLSTLLTGPRGVTFEVLLEVLPALDATPGDFFARLYSFTPREGGGDNGGEDRAAGPAQRLPDRRFEESRRVVKAALARRFAWKQERLAN